jgi:hypothetical protein
MRLLSRDDWYEISHDLDWTLSYAEERDAFPAEWAARLVASLVNTKWSRTS